MLAASRIFEALFISLYSSNFLHHYIFHPLFILFFSGHFCVFIRSWEFLLPEYMVHKGYKPSFDDPENSPARSGAPYYTEKVSVLEREGRSATDKTVKIPEIRRHG